MVFVAKLVQTLLSKGADRATLDPGHPITIHSQDQSTPLSSRALTPDQVQKMVLEVATPHAKHALRDGLDAAFDFLEADHPVHIKVRQMGSRMSMHVELKKQAPVAAVEPPQAPAPEAASGGAGWLTTNMPPEMGARGEQGQAAVAPTPPGEPAQVVPRPQAPARPPASGGGQTEMDAYLMIMFEEGCSDLHLTSNNPPLYRLDGEIAHLRGLPVMQAEQVGRIIYEIMPEANRKQFEAVHDTDFAYAIEGIGRFRVNVFRDRFGPGAVLRIIPSEILTAEKLNLPEHVLDLCWLNKGLVVVTGPTGSGKSTTLAAMIDYINRKRSTHIITIEDPIEFVHPTKMSLLNQREIGVHTMGFKPALRAALREDPDIVLVGEMRDLETIEIAMETAETGHLVFGTLHTNTAPSTVDRIIDQFPADRQAQVRTMLSESLRAVIAQTLCKKEGGGRVAALEILMCTHAISNLIREGKTFQIPSMMSTGKKNGMVQLNDTLLELVQSKTVSPKEAYIKAVDKSSLKARFEREGIKLDL